MGGMMRAHLFGGRREVAYRGVLWAMVVQTTRSADTVGASAWDAKQLRTMDMTRRSAGGARKTYV